MRCKPPLAKKDVREVLTEVWNTTIEWRQPLAYAVVNGVLYFKLRNAIEHVLAIKDTSVKITGVKLPEPTTESAKITGVYML